MSYKIIAISSAGGHLLELIKALPKNIEDNIIYITYKNNLTAETLCSKKHFFIIDPHINKFKYIINMFQSLYLYLKIRPDIIISTGAGIAIPMIMIGYFFKSKIIFIETGARTKSESRTGRFVYNYCDLFIVQYKSQQKFFPKSKLGSL